MSEKEFKNNRPKSDEKDLEGLVQNFSQKVEPATKKVKKNSWENWAPGNACS